MSSPEPSLDIRVEEEKELPLSTVLELLAVLIIIMLIIFSLTGYLPRFLVIQTTSMYPTLKPGDLVMVKKIDPRTLTVGDIIAFDKVVYIHGGTVSGPYKRVITVHRIYSIIRIGNTTYFKTKGDNNPEPDPWYVPPSGVLGIATKVASLGRLGLLLTSPLGRAITFIMIFSSLILIGSAIKRYSEGTETDLERYI